MELTDQDATNLIRLLSASVKKAVGERIVPATDNRKQYYNKAQKVHTNFRCVVFLFFFLFGLDEFLKLADIAITVNELNEVSE